MTLCILLGSRVAQACFHNSPKLHRLRQGDRASVTKRAEIPGWSSVTDTACANRRNVANPTTWIPRVVPHRREHLCRDKLPTCGLFAYFRPPGFGKVPARVPSESKAGLPAVNCQRVAVSAFRRLWTPGLSKPTWTLWSSVQARPTAVGICASCFRT